MKKWLDYVGERVRATHIDQEEALYRLASQLFAVASWIAEDTQGLERPLAHRPPDRPLFKSIEELCHLLGSADSALSTGYPEGLEDLYTLLIEALVLLDTELASEVNRRRQFQPVALEGWPIPGPEPEILIWPRPVEHPSAWRRSRREAFRGTEIEAEKPHGPSPKRDRAKLLEEISAEKTLPPNHERPDLHLHFHTFFRRDDSKIKVSPARPQVAEPEMVLASGADGAGRGFRIALCPIRCAAHPFFEITENRRFFRAHAPQPMIRPETLCTHLDEIVDAAVRDEIHLVLFPELTVDPETQSWLRARLSRLDSRWPYGVLAGSFHEQADDQTLFNRARLLYGSRELMSHEKRGHFYVPRKVIAHSPRLFHESQALSGMLEDLPHRIYEDIEPGSRLEVLDTTLGRFVMIICKDAICTDRGELVQSIKKLRPDFLLLPAMTPETAEFESFAVEMERHEISTFFVNACRLCPDHELLALVQLSHYDSPDGPPTRLAWGKGVEKGSASVRFWDRHAKPKRWKKVSDLDRLPDGFGWLRGVRDKRLGLTVDLAHWIRHGSRVSEQ